GYPSPRANGRGPRSGRRLEQEAPGDDQRPGLEVDVAYSVLDERDEPAVVELDIVVRGARMHLHDPTERCSLLVDRPKPDELEHVIAVRLGGGQLGSVDRQ